MKLAEHGVIAGWADGLLVDVPGQAPEFKIGLFRSFGWYCFRLNLSVGSAKVY